MSPKTPPPQPNLVTPEGLQRRAEILPDDSLILIEDSPGLRLTHIDSIESRDLDDAEWQRLNKRKGVLYSKHMTTNKERTTT